MPKPPKKIKMAKNTHGKKSLGKKASKPSKGKGY